MIIIIILERFRYLAHVAMRSLRAGVLASSPLIFHELWASPVRQNLEEKDIMHAVAQSAFRWLL